eukprot:679151-Amorphochlora_amoeboformis.AAC.1
MRRPGPALRDKERQKEVQKDREKKQPVRTIEIRRKVADKGPSMRVVTTPQGAERKLKHSLSSFRDSSLIIEIEGPAIRNNLKITAPRRKEERGRSRRAVKGEKRKIDVFDSRSRETRGESSASSLPATTRRRIGSPVRSPPSPQTELRRRRVGSAHSPSRRVAEVHSRPLKSPPRVRGEENGYI